MIRRTPTAITITSEDVKEARESIQALRDAQSGRSTANNAAAAPAQAGGDVSGSSSIPDDPMAAAADHLEDQRRRRGVMSRNERIGL